MVKDYLPNFALKTAINASVTSRLDMCNSLLAGICKCRRKLGSVQCSCNIQKLQLVQNNAARLLFRSPKSAEVTPLLKKLHWLPIHARIEYKILTIVYKCLNGTGPLYLTDLLKVYRQNRSLRSGSKGLLLVEPKSKLVTGGDRTFATLGPKLWNNLPRHIREATSLDIYKRALKTHMFSKSYD